MKIILIAAAMGVVVLAGLVWLIVAKVLKRRDLPNWFSQQWLSVQRLCSSKETWVLAVINADKLLDRGLKVKHLKGKSMGERLVSAQRQLSDNDSVWYAHNLAKKLLLDTKINLREAEAKKALVGVRQALRDLGVLNGK